MTVWRMVCLAIGLACSPALAAAQAQGTLFVDSQPGDYIGQGVRRTYTAADGRFIVGRNFRNGITVMLDGPGLFWHLDFAAANDVPLAIGTYESARGSTSPERPWLNVGATGRGCGGVTGRFVVLDIEFTQHQIIRFAADFEQHCGDGLPGLYGAIRYQSGLDPLPFGGAYPVYELSVVSASNGRITSAGVDCGAGANACVFSPAVATEISLTAVPNAGYALTGWTDDCSEASSTTTTIQLRVNQRKLCGAIFEPGVQGRSTLFVDSQPGDLIANGQRSTYTPLDGTFAVSGTPQQGVAVLFTSTDASARWRFDFSAPDGQPLATGVFEAARRHPFTPFNGLSVSSGGRGCGALTGRFVVREMVLAPDGTVRRFAADVEQHCEDVVPALFAAIRFNSTIQETVPFGGVYPSFRLTLTPPVNGRIDDGRFKCDGTDMSCVRTLPGAARLTLSATPDAGYTFMGWTGDCSGGTTTMVHVNGPKSCAALFAPVIPSSPRTVLRWFSELGHPLGDGGSGVSSLENSRWTPELTSSGEAIEFEIRGIGPVADSHWKVRFQAPAGEVLQAGRRYASAVLSAGPGVPGLAIFGNGRACGGGEFTIHEFSHDGPLQFSAVFVLYCDQPAGPRLRGSLRYSVQTDELTTTVRTDPATVPFAALHDGTIVTSHTSAQIVQLHVSRPDVQWVATADRPWIQVVPSSGTGSATLAVGINLVGANPGLINGTGRIAIMLTDGSGASMPVNVAVTLSHARNTVPAFGFIDTPLQNATGVTGAVPMTGWALDDVEVAAVTICRAAVGAEVPPLDPNCGGAAQIYVGSGVFIEGARPDVQAGYATYPRSNSAGWGFMVLTNTLPNHGNGTFVFSVYARDREGHVTLIGTRTLTCDNANAVAPFGTIDTPGQGNTVTGSSYLNFGWALTPNPKQIPIDGSTMMVYVDGVAIGSPTYNEYRADVATLFPGLANSDGAVGFRVIDTTTLTNGLHTIVWTATDSAGITSGLGSRFFRVANGAADAMEAVVSATTVATIDSLPIVTSAITARRGWDPAAAWGPYTAGRSGRIVMRGEEIDRFEIAFGGRQGERWSGYTRVGGDLAALPIGSRLDAQTGAFTWSPGVGFVGTYDLVFVRSEGNQPVARREVRFILNAKGSGHVGTQVVIDTPRPQQDLAQPFLLGGWAADLDATAGTGIDTLHVWVYPLAGGDPIFLGTATYGGARPDVAAVHGEQFRSAAFGISVQGLPHGHYDLAVFAWSNVSGGFVPAKVVRITAR